MHTEIHLHAGASRPVQWPTDDRPPVHLRRGDIHGSYSGYFCACMALITLGVTTRTHIQTSHAVPDGKLQDFFAKKAASATGLDPAKMSELLMTADRFVKTLQLEGKRDWLARSAAERLEDDEVCLLCLGDEKYRYAEWKLAVGLESAVTDHRRRAMALLVLDPNASIGRIATWNGRLELTYPPDEQCLYYMDVNGTMRPVTLKTVFTLRRRSPWET